MNYDSNEMTLMKLTRFSNYIGLSKPYNSVIFINRNLFKDEQEDALKLETSKARSDEINKKTEKDIEPKNGKRVTNLINHHQVVKETIKFAKTIAPIILNSPKSNPKCNTGRKHNKNSNITFKDYNDYCELKTKFSSRNYNRVYEEKSSYIRENPKTREIGTQYEENLDNSDNRERKLGNLKVYNEKYTMKNCHNFSIQEPIEEEFEDDTLYEINSSSFHSDGSHFMKGDSKLIKRKYVKREIEKKSVKVKKCEFIEMLGTVLKTEENDTEIKFTLMNHQEKKQFADEISSLIVQAIQLQAQNSNDSTITDHSTYSKPKQIKNPESVDFPNTFSESEKISRQIQEPCKLHKNLREQICNTEILVKSTRSKLHSSNKRSPLYTTNLKPNSNINEIGNNVEKDTANEMNDDQILDYFQTLHDNNCEDMHVENIDDDQNYPQLNDVTGTDPVNYQATNLYEVKNNTQHCISGQQINQQELRMQGINCRIPARTNCWSTTNKINNHRN